MLFHPLIIQLRETIVFISVPRFPRKPEAGLLVPVLQKAMCAFFCHLQEGEWGPLFTLLPEFLMSGAVQRAVQSAQEFG